MTPEQLKRLRTYRETIRAYHSFLDAERERGVHSVGDGATPITDTLELLAVEFPNLRYAAHLHTDLNTSIIRNLVPLLGMAAAAVDSELVAATATSPAPARLFPFVVDGTLRDIIERNDRELAVAVANDCWKTVLILCGGAIEGVLLDLLSQPANYKNAMAKAPPNRKQQPKPLEEWDLSHLIDVAHALKLITPNVKGFAHTVREYRNLVHPGLEKRSPMVVGPLEAQAARTVLDMLHAALA